MLRELNIDAMVGPTHNYGGLGVGNVASSSHSRSLSHPRQAALEGLDKAAYVARLGVPQYLLPPPPRPAPGWLSNVGFSQERVADQLKAARQTEPVIFSAAVSSAFMWAANAGTFTPACDSADNKHHLTLANLCSSWHRATEHEERYVDFKNIFRDLGDAMIHRALPGIVPLRDEGAANHMRLCDATGLRSVHVFVYGDSNTGGRPRKNFARQSLAACQAVARMHRLNPETTFYLQQHPDAIDAGVFHNDVIATSHENLLLHHEFAFIDAEAELSKLEEVYRSWCGRPLLRITVNERQLPLQEAVSTYLFNSQLLTPINSINESRMILLATRHCEHSDNARRLIEHWIGDPQVPIDRVQYVKLDQSMANGGGPACLRLRLQLPSEQIESLNPAYRWTEAKDHTLRQTIERYYPDSLTWDDLASAEYLQACNEAQHQISKLFC